MQHSITVETLVTEMNERITSIMLAEAKKGIIPRFNQPKTVAYLNGEFQVHNDLPIALRHGIFAQPNTYPAKLRFANASNQDDSQKDIRGLSLRLANVQQKTLWGDDGYQDFLLNSHPALFVATPEDFLEFIRARQEGKLQQLLFFLTHPKALYIVLKSRKKHLSPLDIRYWSTVPFRLGEASQQVVKYSLLPCSNYQTTEVVEPGENQLRAAIKAHLQQGSASFHFAVQLQTDPSIMPIEDASVIWDESVSPFIPVATLTINPQPVDDPELLALGERSTFNPWQCLAAHEPLGRMNLVRRPVYTHAAALRHQE